jgi:hypothetical protein
MLQAGYAGCLNKPVQFSELYRAVQRAIEPTPRQNTRVPVLLSATIDDIASGTEIVTVLSDSGLFVRTHEPRTAGSKHTVTFLLNGRASRPMTSLYANRFEEYPRTEPWE